MRKALFLAVLIAAPAHASSREDAREAMSAGVAHFYAGDARAARIDLLNATKADPGWALPHAVAARVALALGDGEGADAEIGRAVAGGVPEKSLVHLRMHVWLLAGEYARVLAASPDPGIRTVSVAYAHRIRARAAMATGNLSMAAAELGAARALAPNSSLLWFDVGRFRLATGDIGGAIEAAMRASALDPRNVEALLLTGELTRSQYGLTAAIPWFERVLEIDKVNIGAMLQMAATLGDAGRTREMLAMTRRVLAADPANAQALYLQAVLAARAGRADIARKLIYRTGARLDALPGMLLLKSVLAMQDGNGEQAIALLRRLIEAQPNNLRAQQLLGAALFRAGDPVGAIEVLGPMAQRADADVYTLSIAARAFEAGGDRERAAALLDRAGLSVRAAPLPFATAPAPNPGNPDDAAIAVPRIAVLVAAGNAGAALAEAQRIAARNTGVPAAHILVGDTLMALGRPKDAAKAYASAANIRFTEPEAMRFIAAFQQSGDGLGALRVLNLYLAQNPRSVPALRLASDHFMATGQWDSAISVLEGLRQRLGNRDATIVANLGWASFKTGDADEGLRFSRAAYTLEPSNAAVAGNYGWILFRSNHDRRGGAALLRKAVAIAPYDPLLRRRLSLASR